MKARLVAGALLLAVASIGVGAQEPARLLRAAMNLETVDGDCEGAIALYEEVAAGSDRPLAAHALLRMAGCHQKLHNGRAQRVYERIVTQYQDQPEAVAVAQAQLRALGADARPHEPPGPRLLCETCGDIYGSISADGRLMVSAGPMAPTQGPVYLYDFATRTQTVLTDPGTAGEAYLPVLSPDATEIAYTFGRRPAQLRVASRTAPHTSRVLVDNPEFQLVLAASWLSRTMVLAIVIREDTTWELHRVSTVTGRTERLKSLGWRLPWAAHALSVSPDGRYIAYAALPDNPPAPVAVRYAGESQIYVLATDLSSETTITSGAGSKRGPVWSSDGSHVLFTNDLAGTTDLWATPVRAGRIAGDSVLVRKNLGDVTSLGMTKTGLYHYLEERRGLFRTAIATISAGRPGKPAQTFVGQYPSWSPDGRSIAVHRPANPSGGVNLVVRTLEGGNERVYSRAGLQPQPAMWFPDGRALLVLARGGEGLGWDRLDLESGRFTRVASLPGPSVVWARLNVRVLSHDGRTLYLAARSAQDATAGTPLDQIVALDLTTGGRRTIFRLPGAADVLPYTAGDVAIAASPDGRALAMLSLGRNRDSGRLATVGVDGTGYRELKTSIKSIPESVIPNRLVWSRDGDGEWIYFLEPLGPSADSRRVRVVRISAHGGGEIEPVGLEVDDLEVLALSPDGTRLAYGRSRPDEGEGRLVWALDVSAVLKRPVRGADAN